MKAINIVSPDVDFLGRPGRCADAHRPGSLEELRTVLVQRLEHVDAAATTLDLSGHSTRGARLLRLGSTPIDMLNPQVASFFREVADSGLLPRLAVVAVRLLGCQTAVTDSGRRTIRMLEHVLGIAVWGTRKVLIESHYDDAGFRPEFSHLLQN